MGRPKAPAAVVRPAWLRADPLWLGGVYRKVVENELIEQTHVWDEEGHQTILTVQFEDEGRKTRMTMRQTQFASVASRDGHRGGWMECLERLDALLATNPSRTAV